MNFLQLCQRVASKAGITTSGILTTVGQQGEALRIVNWVQDDYIDIQEKNDNWFFLRKDFEFTCVPGQSVYPKETIANFGNWLTEDIRCYLSTQQDEQWLEEKSWRDFKATRLMGSARTVPGRPQDYAIKPDKSFVTYPIPNDYYIINGEYYQSARLFTGDTDVPLFDQHHMVIVYQALMFYAAYSSDAAVYADSQKNYERLIDKLEINQMDELELSGSLA